MSSLRGKQVLLVEDEVLIALDTASILEEAGSAGVVTVTTCDKALAAIATQRFHAAILDVKIGNDYSTSVADALVRLKIPFIYATGYSDTNASGNMHADVPVVLKPYDPASLMQTLCGVF